MQVAVDRPTPQESSANMPNATWGSNVQRMGYGGGHHGNLDYYTPGVSILGCLVACDWAKLFWFFDTNNEHMRPESLETSVINVHTFRALCGLKSLEITPYIASSTPNDLGKIYKPIYSLSMYIALIKVKFDLFGNIGPYMLRYDECMSWRCTNI